MHIYDFYDRDFGFKNAHAMFAVHVFNHKFGKILYTTLTIKIS